MEDSHDCCGSPDCGSNKQTGSKYKPLVILDSVADVPEAKSALNDSSNSGKESDAASTAVFRIQGMDCVDCARTLEKKVGAMAGVRNVQVNFGAAKMTVNHTGLSIERITQETARAGYTAIQQGSARTAQSNELPVWKRNRKLLPALISGVLFILAWGVILAGGPEPVVWFFFGAAVAAGGFHIAKSGWIGLKSRTVGMEFLMTVAVIGAMAIGEWMEAAAVVVLFSLGEALESFTMDRTRLSIHSLMEMAPNEALVRRGSAELQLHVDDIRIGDTIIVKPGEKIAMDGRVVNGFSAVNEAPITGESIPAEKTAGDEVFAGTINGQGSLEIEVTKLAGDNTLSRIIHMVEEAQAKKAPFQRFVDVFAKYYTPAVIGAAFLVAVAPSLFFGLPFDVWFYRALMLLVVACPCALVISTPVSIVSAIGNAARNGILFKGGTFLERLGTASAIAFDKTGTLTSGVPTCSEVIPTGPLSKEKVLAIAAGIERLSEHPLAEAVVRKAREWQIPIPDCARFDSVTGKGAHAEIEGTRYFIGKPKWFREELGLSPERFENKLAAMEHNGRTVILLGTADRILGMLGIADDVREQAKSVLEQLKQAGFRKLAMLTGDNERAARAIGSGLEAIDVHSELLPEGKVDVLKQLKREHKAVVMVGDGINDAPALAEADIGIAMGAAGTDTALETADVALMADDLTKLPYAVRLSRRTVRIIKQNIAFSLLIKALFLGLILIGGSTLWMAVLADVGSSLLVILNGMRLLRTPLQ